MGDNPGMRQWRYNPRMRSKNSDSQDIVPGSARPASLRGFYADLVVIAASTGGPPAVDAVLSGIGERFPAPILLVQHTLPRFSEMFADGLRKTSKLSIKVAQGGERVEPSTVYIAPGGVHLLLAPGKQLLLDDSPPVNGVRPAADPLLVSVSHAAEFSRILAVILTGMGRDGEAGVAAVKRAKHCACVAQSARTCVVYGMPRAVVESGLADMILDLERIAQGIESFAPPWQRGAGYRGAGQRGAGQNDAEQRDSAKRDAGRKGAGKRARL